MNKKIKAIIGLACLGALSLGISACSTNTKVDEFKEQGKVVTVTYNSNGGRFMNRDGVSIMDMFNPKDYTADSNGEVHIKLLEPTSAQRPTSGGDKISLTRQGYFFAGWYESRELVKNDAGEVIDDHGVALEYVESTDSYIYSDTKEVAIPAYNYDGYWDFASETVDCKADTTGEELTLYAGWVPYYEFEYYCQNAAGEWELYSTTTFDYKAQQATSGSNRNTIWVPKWDNGKMKYQTAYSDKQLYDFPALTGKTFASAYTDPACQNKIENEFVHPGSLNLEKAKAINPVQKIYVKFDDGEKFRITTAKQLHDYAKVSGEYEIMADLDFESVSWPNAFMTGTFTGKLFSTEGHQYKISNVNVRFTSTSASFGGMFGTIAKKAVVKDLVFENVTFDLASASGRLANMRFGTLAGNIQEGAGIANVTLKNASMKLGPISLQTGYQINLVANGDTSNIAVEGKVALTVYGQSLPTGQYKYMILPETVKVDGEKNVTATFTTSKLLDQDKYEIQYDI